METSSNTCSERVSVLSPIFAKDEFSRLDESDDAEFYAKDRFVSHLDSFALSTVEGIIGDLVIEKEPVILDLMAEWDSNIQDSLKPKRVVGIGLNENELRRNRALTEHVILVDEFFKHSGAFEKTRFFASKGKPRPRDDKYANLTDVSDPVYSVYAEKRGGDPGRRAMPDVAMSHREKLDSAVLEKKPRINETLRYPYCDEKLSKCEVPDNPFCQTWDNYYMYICFNDGCPYFVRGWDRMYRETNQSMSYRLMYNPEKDRCMLRFLPEMH